MTTSTAVVVRPMTDADLPDVLNLLQMSLAGGPTGQRTRDFFEWKHRDNPFGRSPAWVAVEGGQLAGFRIFMRWSFRSDDQTIHAVRAVDTATHPDYRGQGIFRRLTTTALGSLGESVAMVFNTPNDQSLPGYLRMGWQVVGRVRIFVHASRPVRVLRTARHGPAGPVGGSPPGARCPLPSARSVLEQSPSLAPFLEDVAARDEPKGRFRTVRDHGYLSWRYAGAPGLDYRALVVGEHRAPRGLAIGRPRYRGNLVEFTLSEVICADDRTAADLLRQVARQSGADHVTCHLPVGAVGRSRLVRAGYFPVPGGPTLVTRPLVALPRDPGELASWALTLGDVEVF
jgi:GNAT superfamily N-acetyltransferase